MDARQFRPAGLIHRFSDQLEYSSGLSDEPAWIAFYRGLWPDLMLVIRIDRDSEWQRHGVDREIVMPNGKRFYIDEKKRKKDYGDVLLEEWSVFHAIAIHATRSDGRSTTTSGATLSPTLCRVRGSVISCRSSYCDSRFFAIARVGSET